jgi:hypothetical protein
MKTLLLSFTFYLFSGITAEYIDNCIGANNIETIGKITVRADAATHCNETRCVASMKEKAKSYKRSVVLYKAGDKWVVERNKERQIKAIESYSGKDMAIWQGHLKLDGVTLTDQAQIVALN